MNRYTMDGMQMSVVLTRSATLVKDITWNRVLIPFADAVEAALASQEDFAIDDRRGRNEAGVF